ncbi:MAG: DNA-binding CsgD family transcriptional regulator [Crocinitomix sp.]
MNNPNENRTILIGCDELSHLSVMLNALSQPSFKSYSFLTFSRPDQLLRAVVRDKTALVILSFKQNQYVVNEFYSKSANRNVSLFCFTQNNNVKPLSWPAGTTVFTYPLLLALDESSIANRLSSVLALSNPPVNRDSRSFVPFQNGSVGVRDLSRYALELDQKNIILDRIKTQVETIALQASKSVRFELRAILIMIKQAKSDQKYWNEFKEHFNRMNPGFLQTLSQKHPSLTAKDLKYCCYLRMNLSNNEITRLMGINQESVRTHKYRLKKKMVLNKEENLEHYLIRVNSRTNRIPA